MPILKRDTASRKKKESRRSICGERKEDVSHVIISVVQELIMHPILAKVSNTMGIQNRS